ncbi:MAG TPA: APC family permease [Rhodoglobus sp.]|nr:APC family permease [Rhodoglobus sp.]
MTTLQRRLGLPDALTLGLGAMLGAGVFAAFAPAARAAGPWLLAGLAIAAVVAFCNATASAQLAAQYPTSGGTYVYGRERLGPWWGFLAGWGFVIGKTASCAAMALTFAAYAAPEGWERPVAALAALALGGVNLLGITRTALVTRILVVLVLVTLGVVVAAGGAAGPAPAATLGSPDPYGILQAAGLLFFAFAGYARIATLGEEVRDPERTIPRAIVLSLGIVVVIYAVVGTIALTVLGSDRLAAADAPLAEVAVAAGWGWADPVIRVGAAAASLGALLALMAGVGRTTLAMAREGDLPRPLAAVHPRFSVPHRAEALLTVVVVAVVLLVDVRGAIAFSSFGVLLYYAIANAAAFTQTRRRYPRALQVVGLVGCLVLVATLPALGIAIGVAVLLLGVGVRTLLRRIDGPAEPSAA